MHVETIEQKSGRYVALRRLYTAHSSTLGFMPEGAFAERAAKGTLLAAVTDDDETAGYVLYDLPRRHIAIRHLCIADNHRKSGLARLLVDEVAHRHPERDGILLDCRNDFPAHPLWPKLDFEPLSEAPGRSRAGYPLTSWWRDFGHPTLFSSRPELEPPILRIAIDTDVFIDLYEDRANCDESRGLMVTWVREVAQLVITKEVVTEVNGHPDSTTRNRNRNLASSFPRADVATAEWEAVSSRLKTALGAAVSNEHDRRDLDQVARAAAAGVDYFVSRDADLVKRYAKAASELFGLRVTAPGDFLQELWQNVGEPYAPAQIEHTLFRLEAALPSTTDELADAFLDTRQGEKKREFLRALRSLRADPSNCEVKVIRHGNGQPVALFGRSISGQVLNVAMLRVTGSAARTIARHVAHLQKVCAAERGVSLVHVADSYLSPNMTSALIAEAFIHADDGWWAATICFDATADVLASKLTALTDAPARLGLATAAERLRSGVQRETASELERRFSPMKIAGAPLPTYLVPIRPHWAEQLFDTELSSQTLLPREDTLGMSREHVYYSGAAPGVLSAPARILWYVSAERVAGGNRAGTSAIRACSRLEEVVRDRPLTLYRRFSHLGTYKEKDILAAANKQGLAMAIRFADTELLTQPITLSDLRKVAFQCGHTLVLRSPHRLSEQMFDALYHQGTHASS